jgi:hypothetical protein
VHGALRGTKGAHACQVDRTAGPGREGRGAWPRRRRAHGTARSSAARAPAIARACGREVMVSSTMTDAWSRRDGIRTVGDVGPARCAGAAPTTQRRARGALRRPSSQTFRYARL